MLKLSDEQKAILKNAIDRAQRIDGLDSSLQHIYQEFQIELDQRKPKCDASGRCCHFEAFGHRLFVSTIELVVFASKVGRGELKWDGTGCPFHVDGLCSVHDSRPFGCRIFFCDPTSVDWQSSNYERFHSKIKSLHESFGVDYLYVEWREGLSVLGISGSTDDSAGDSPGDRLRVIKD
ncbi:MAG TPA: hypothetical protein PK402_11280 [Tepidisphaeraceae bacterium]|nr:hypothetical protein [Tepidisphaeraceae bacterium]